MSAPPPTERRYGWRSLLILGFLVAGLILESVVYFRHRQADARSTAQAGLEAIADLKVQQIVTWRRQRLADANLIRATPYFAQYVLDALAQTDSARTRQILVGCLAPLLAVGPYEQALLLDDRLNVRLVHPEIASRVLADPELRSAEEALRTRQVVVTDLHQSAEDGEVYLDFVVPLLVRREGTNDDVPAAGVAASPADRGAGVLVLRLNAREFLFPLIQSWPAPSLTAESLLVRREGQELLYLNELRHRKRTAMKLRRHMDEELLPAAMGLRGKPGMQEGIDYRGVRVVAAVLRVPDTPWLMEAKVDVAELYTPLWRDALGSAAGVLALLTAAAAAVALLWRQRNERFLQAQLAVERERRTAAEQVKETLRETEAQIRKMLVMAPVPMCHLNRDGMLVFRNERFVQVFGYTAEDVPALAEWWQRACPDPQYRQWAIETWDEAVRRAVAGERDIVAADYRVTCKSGKERIVDISGITLGEELLVTFIDVTEHKRAKEALRKFNAELEWRVRQRTAELEAAMKELDAFAYSVSHDLRAPLRHVSGFAELLRTSAGPSLPDQSRHYLEEITGSATQMGRLIDDLLQFARMGRIELRHQRLELAELVEEGIQELRPEINGRNILWKKNPLPEVQADSALLRQVLANLLANAIKYTRPRDPAKIEIGCASENGQETVIFIRDNGVGFDMQYADRLFGVFQRLHADEEFEGTGVGLANVRRIIARHGGRTWAEGKVDEGATFYFSLPAPGPRSDPEQEAVACSTVAADGSRRTPPESKRPAASAPTPVGGYDSVDQPSTDPLTE